MNDEFFDRLFCNAEFCETLGRMTLAAGQLESALRQYLSVHGIDFAESQANLGELTRRLVGARLLSKNGQGILEGLGKQRNHFVHKLYDLFSDRVAKPILPHTNLVDGDESTFTDYALVLTENITGLTATVNMRLAEEDPSIDRTPGASPILF